MQYGFFIHFNVFAIASVARIRFAFKQALEYMEAIYIILKEALGNICSWKVRDTLKRILPFGKKMFDLFQSQCCTANRMSGFYIEHITGLKWVIVTQKATLPMFAQPIWCPCSHLF